MFDWWPVEHSRETVILQMLHYFHTKSAIISKDVRIERLLGAWLMKKLIRSARMEAQQSSKTEAPIQLLPIGGSQSEQTATRFVCLFVCISGFVLQSESLFRLDRVSLSPTLNTQTTNLGQ